MATLGSAFERLSPRDRLLLVVLAATVFVGGTGIAWQLVSSKQRAKERQIEGNRRHLASLQAGREAFQKQQAKAKEREAVLRVAPPPLRRLLEGAARSIGVTIDDLKDRPVPAPAKASNIEEQSMEARITNVAYDKVVKLLAEIESSVAVIVVRELRMDYKDKETDTFREVRFTVSSFHLKGGAEATPAAAPTPAPSPSPSGALGPTPFQPSPPGTPGAPSVAAPGAPAPASAPVPAPAPASAPVPAPAPAPAPAPPATAGPDDDEEGPTPRPRGLFRFGRVPPTGISPRAIHALPRPLIPVRMPVPVEAR